MENKNEAQMIYIKDLIFTALARWKALLAVALIFAVLLGGWKIYSGLSDARSVTTETQDEYLIERDNLELAVTQAQAEIDSYQDYLTNAPLMQLNPYAFYELHLSLFIQTDYKILPGMEYQDPDQTANILHAYTTALRSSATLDALAEALETQSQYLPELMTNQWNGSTLQLFIKLPTEAAAQELLPILISQATAAKEEIDATVKEHTLTVTEQTVLPKVDPSITDHQTRNKARLTTLEEALITAENALSALNSNSAAPVFKKYIAKQTVIFAVLGAVLGVFGAVCVIWVMHICSDKIYDAKNLTNRTGLKVIGTLGVQKKYAIDRMLYRWEGRAESGLENSPTPLDIRCRAKGSKHLLITGSGKAEDRQALVSAIAQAMPGTLVEDKGSILRDAAALEALDSCDLVIIAETCRIGSYSSAEKQAQIIHDYNTALMGCVLMER